MRSAWFTVVVSTVVFVLLVLPLAHGLRRALPHNPVKLSVGDELFSTAYFPQGWAFFTRDAREPRRIVFRHNGQGWEHANNGSTFTPKYWFGIDRTGRAQSIEIGRMIREVSEEMWEECRDRPETCLDSSVTAFSMENESPDPTLCGRIGISAVPPVPWTWARSGRNIVMPSKVVIGEIKCRS